MAERLPAARVVSAAGGHDWTTWLALWRQLLDRGIFGFGGDGIARHDAAGPDENARKRAANLRDAPAT
jgi:hypothetical protein